MKGNKIVVICGPTATGKSALAVEIAKTFDGEVVSADSRQVYRGLDIGSAKITRKEMNGIPHHLIDVADPRETFTVSEFKRLADEAIAGIRSRGRLPILCGGTGMYISAVVDDRGFPDVDPDPALRERLGAADTASLFKTLHGIDPVRAEKIDPNNRVRLVRAIEIAMSPESGGRETGRVGKAPRALMIGLTLQKEGLVSRIARRIDDRIPALFDEIKKLLGQGVSETRMRELGLEYRYGTDHVAGRMGIDEFRSVLATRTWQYVRRQYTWFRRDERIRWMDPVLGHDEIIRAVKDFLD